MSDIKRAKKPETARDIRFKVRTDRMEAFSDGVFAIAITLLVLDIAIPSIRVPHIGVALLGQWPTYLAYTVSFASIGAAWLNHNLITDYLDYADNVLLRLNLLLLFFISLLPFPTHMVSEFISATGPERIAVTVYGMNLLAIIALTSLLWHYAKAEHLIRKDMPDDELRTLTAKIDPSLVSYVAVLGIGLLLPRLAVALYLAIALFIMLPFRTIARYLRDRS